MKRVRLLVALIVVCVMSSLSGCSFMGYKIVKEDEQQQLEDVMDEEVTQIPEEITEEVKEEVEVTPTEVPVEKPVAAEVIPLDYSDRINLKSLEEGKTYKLDLVAGRSGKKSTYNLVNNTSKDVLIYSHEDGVDFEVCTLELRHSFPKAVNVGYSGGIKTEADYVVFRYEILSDVNAVLNHVDSSRLVRLSTKGVNVEFKVGNIRYIYNDTDIPVELVADNGTGYSIPVKTVAEFTSQGYISLKRVR